MMKEKIKKYGSWAFVLLGVMCVLLNVGDANAVGGVAVATVVPVGGGAVNAAMTTATQTREDSRNLLLDTIDEKVTKIRPHDVVLDTISRHIGDVKTVNNQIYRHYAIDVIDLVTTVKDAVSGTPEQVALSTNNNEIFASEQTIKVEGVKGYKEDGTTLDPVRELMLYVVGKDTSGKPLVVAVNGQKTGNKILIPNIGQGTKLVRMGRAGSETQIQTDPYSGVPTDWNQYLQKFMAQIEVSDIFERADKEADWSFTDMEEEAIFDMKRTMNVTLWCGVRYRLKTKNAHTQKAEDIYFTEGIWSQAGKDFSFNGQPIDAKNLVTLMKHAFTGNASGKRKLLLCGSDVIEQLEQVEYDKTVKLGDKQTIYGLDVSNIISKFGTLSVVHDQTLDDMGMSKKFFVLDVDFLRKVTMGWRVNEFDFRKSGQADADGRGLMEICGLVLKNPNAHSRGSLV